VARRAVARVGARTHLGRVGTVRIRTGGWIAVTLGALASVALAAFTFFRIERSDGGLRLVARFDFGAWAASLPSHLPWVVPFAVLVASLSATRAMVWACALPPPAPGWASRFHAIALGSFVHNAVPGHLGVPAAAWVLHRHAGAPLAVALSSLLLAKLLEFAALVAVTMVLALVASALAVPAAPTGTALWAGLGALVVFTLALASVRRLAPVVATRLRVRGRLPRVSAALIAVSVGLATASSARRLLGGVALGLLPVVAAALGYALALRHMGVEAYLLGGGLLLGAVTLAQVTPGLPVVGLYYVVCAGTARALGVADEPAAALALLSHIVGIMTHLVIGGAVALAHHDRLRELFQLRAQVRRPSVAAPP